MTFKNIRIAVRGIIIDKNEILVVKHKKEFDYFSFPGGGVNPGETLTNALSRELKEETNIIAQIGKQRFIQELILSNEKGNHHLLEFFFLIKNGSDFRHTNLKKSSHGFEIFEMKWLPLSANKIKVLPKFILPSLQESIQTNNPEFFSSINK